MLFPQPISWLIRVWEQSLRQETKIKTKEDSKTKEKDGKVDKKVSKNEKDSKSKTSKNKKEAAKAPEKKEKAKKDDLDASTTRLPWSGFITATYNLLCI